MSEELIEEGIVLESENGFADIKLLANDNCDECSAKIICKPKDDSGRILKIENTVGVQKGDKVTIAISGKSLFGAAVNLYLYPLIIFIAAVLLGLNLFVSYNIVELYAFLLGCLSLSIYYMIFFVISKRPLNKQPTVCLTKSN